MHFGDYVVLAGVALIVAAIVLGKRKGRKNYAAALASARAEGRAELRAELSAIATANGGQVVINYGVVSSDGPGDLPALHGATYDHRPRLDHHGAGHDDDRSGLVYDVRPELVRHNAGDRHEPIGGLDLPGAARRGRVAVVPHRSGLRRGAAAHPAGRLDGAEGSVGE